MDDLEADWLWSSFEEHFPSDLPRPNWYVTPSDAVVAEWTLGTVRVSAKIDVETRDAVWEEVDRSTMHHGDREIDLSGNAGWDFLVERVRLRASE